MIAVGIMGLLLYAMLKGAPVTVSGAPTPPEGRKTLNGDSRDYRVLPVGEELRRLTVEEARRYYRDELL